MRWAALVAKEVMNSYKAYPARMYGDWAAKP